MLWLTFGALAAGETVPTAPSVSIAADGAVAMLNWSGGRPTYQLQKRASFSGPWQNVGQPTTETTAAVPLADTPAFFRVVADYTARFEVLFDSTWSQQTHPGAWPPGAHWSGPVGGVHNDKVHFWKEGDVASEGIRLMAERGQQGTLAAEIQATIPAGHAYFTLTASGLGSPGQRLITFPQATTRDFPLLTLVSMIAPSPDWFTGVAGLNLLGADGEWIEEQTVTLYGFDAGTDSGADFTSPDLVTAPRGVVTRFEGYPARINGTIVPFGTLTVRRIE
ncbi:MAG: spondin domain-containing protein [Verrucomicrobiales bacterium]|nr:spondin domain-containing protein [Verrucomicrobiales bacterium]